MPDLPAATNRVRSTPNIDTQALVGVDTIRLRGPVSPATLTRLDLGRGRVRVSVDPLSGEATDHLTFTMSDDSSPVRKQVITWRGEPELVMEVSLPRLRDADNTFAVPVHDLADLISDVHQDAACRVDWLCEARDLEVLRLDVVRDFTAVEQGWEHLRGLAQVPAKRATTVTYSAAGAARIQTLYRTTKRWQARLYLRADKVASGGPLRLRAVDLVELNRDRLRYELQMGSTILGEQGLRHVKDLDQEPLEFLARQRFDRCRFNVPVGAGLEKARRIHADLTANDQTLKARGLFGQLWMDHFAGSDLDRSRTANKHRKAGLDSGMTPADLLPAGTAKVVRRLDFDAGLLLAV